MLGPTESTVLALLIVVPLVLLIWRSVSSDPLAPSGKWWRFWR